MECVFSQWGGVIPRFIITVRNFLKWSNVEEIFILRFSRQLADVFVQNVNRTSFTSLRTGKERNDFALNPELLDLICFRNTHIDLRIVSVVTTATHDALDLHTDKTFYP